MKVLGKSVQLTGKKRLAALLVGVLLVLLGATFALEAFLDDPGRDESWVAAISAISTLVLVVVTCIYVAFTGQLVKLQQSANTYAAQLEDEKVVRRVLETLHPAHRTVQQVASQFPLDDELDPPLMERVRFDLSAMNELKGSLRAVSPQLPLPLRLATLRTAIAISDAVLSCQAVGLATLREFRRVKEESADFSWRQVRANFYEESDVREAISDGRDRAPEWADIRDGTYLHEAMESVSGLEAEFASWLLERASARQG